MNPFVQDLIAIGIGLVAFAYLCHRWWPSILALFKPTAQDSACGEANGPTSGTASCGSGCGQCGRANASHTKDHRVHVVKRPPAAKPHA